MRKICRRTAYAGSYAFGASLNPLTKLAFGAGYCVTCGVTLMARRLIVRIDAAPPSQR
jgi:hypothetical protein